MIPQKRLDETRLHWWWMLAMLAIAGALCVWLQAKFEAQAFERITGKHVSTWDAIWIDLRVDETTIRVENANR